MKSGYGRIQKLTDDEIKKMEEMSKGKEKEVLDSSRIGTSTRLPVPRFRFSGY